MTQTKWNKNIDQWKWRMLEHIVYNGNQPKYWDYLKSKGCGDYIGGTRDTFMWNLSTIINMTHEELREVGDQIERDYIEY